jgi:serine/threonine protein kinase/ankyrin repeat protein
MNTEWERVNQLFHEATECAEEERAGFVARSVQSDPALQRDVQSLIEAHKEDDDFLENPAIGKSLFLRFGGWQRRIIDALLSPAGKVSVGTDGMIGQLLDGKYEIEELCGRGGMGAVYRATHVGTGRRVAVKVIAPELAGDSEFIERFRREAKTIGLLRHPNIVNVTDFGVTGAGEGPQTIAYLVMEYLEGQTLAEWLKNTRPAPIDRTNNCYITEIEYERMKGPRVMPVNDAIAILSQTCAAMDEAHRLGVLHRDLKPENIWLEPAGSNGDNVKVLDFGIARLQNIIVFDELKPPPEVGEPAISHQPFSITEDETLRLNYTGRQMSRFGSVMGTPMYMSPEQCRRERLDKSSDVYSLGVIAYQMLTGEPPFTGTTPELLIRHREADPARLREKRRDIPAGVDAVVRQALAKDKNARPATAGAFAFQLQLNSEGNEWIRRQADLLARKYRWKFLEIALRMQWKGWLVSSLLLLATLKLPGMSSMMSVAVFGLLWLVVAAITILGQNATTAACSLFLEQTEGGAKQAPDLRSIGATVRRRSRDLARAACRLIIPTMIHEELSVEEARQRWATLKAPIRRQTAYPLFRRLLAFVLNIAAWQLILIHVGFLVDGGIERRSDNLSLALLVSTPTTLVVFLSVFILSLKSSIEQSALYRAARQALGDIPTDVSFVHRDLETKAIFQTSYWKTYVPTCALILLVTGLQVFRIDTGGLMHSRRVYGVKALNASGVPIPFWSLSKANPSVISVIQSPRMTKYLLDKGANVNAPVTIGAERTPPGIGDVVSTPLMAALRVGSIDSARMLIERGADVHAQDSVGRTPMTIAVTYNQPAISLLLASGVDINEQTRFGTPLLTAARYQWFYPEQESGWGPGVFFISVHIKEEHNAVRILLEKGADPNIRDSEGRNALMVMSLEKRSENAVELIAETLLNAGCDINAADNKGRSPLMYAAIFERPGVVKLLLKRGANINAKDHDGLSALDLAKKSGNEEINRLLSLR